jgi:flagellar hook-associated protein 1 FlgK
MGLEAQDAAEQKTFFQGLVDQFSQMRDSVSGVSLDEELTNLVKYQRAYQAASRLVSVADELYQTLLNLGK